MSILGNLVGKTTIKKTAEAKGGLLDSEQHIRSLGKCKQQDGKNNEHLDKGITSLRGELSCFSEVIGFLSRTKASLAFKSVYSTYLDVLNTAFPGLESYSLVK